MKDPAKNKHIRDELVRVDDKLNAMYQTQREKINQPVCAFVTFTTLEAKERALKYYCKVDKEGQRNHYYTEYGGFNSGGMVLEVEEAPEPSEIIWENIEILKESEARRCSVFAVAITVLLAISFVTMSLLKKASAAN